MPGYTLCGINLDPYLALNGVELEPPQLVGAERLAFGGGCRSDVAARKRVWSVRTVPLAADVAAALRLLAQEKSGADVLSFDADLYSAQGLTRTGSGDGFVTASGAKYGSCIVPGSNLSYAVGAGSEWTLMGWRRNGGDSLWRHFIRLSTGQIYKDGFETLDTPPFDISGEDLLIEPGYDYTGLDPWGPETVYEPGDKVVGAGRVFTSSDETSGTNTVEPDWASAPDPDDEVEEDPDGLEGGPWVWTNLPNFLLDDVVFLPFLAPEAWVPQLHAEHSARAWTAPQLRLAGDLVGPAVRVRGSIGRGRGVPHWRGGAYERAGQVLEFRLEEE